MAFFVDLIQYFSDNYWVCSTGWQNYPKAIAFLFLGPEAPAKPLLLNKNRLLEKLLCPCLNIKV